MLIDWGYMVPVESPHLPGFLSQQNITRGQIFFLSVRTHFHGVLRCIVRYAHFLTSTSPSSALLESADSKGPDFQFQDLNSACSSAALQPRFSALSCSSAFGFFFAAALPLTPPRPPPVRFCWSAMRCWTAAARRSRSCELLANYNSMLAI